jgi:hypothetical protein
MQYTPYAAHIIVNAALKEAGLDKAIPPQMMYNYTTARINKGKTPLIEAIVVDGKVFITEEALAKWTAKYVAKSVALANI